MAAWRVACKDWNSKQSFGEKHVRSVIPNNGCIEIACKAWNSKQTFEEQPVRIGTPNRQWLHGEQSARIGIPNRHLMRSM